MFRAYNRYAGKQCKTNSKRLKWAGLLPLRDTREGIEALREMQELGASAAVVFGTAGKRLLSHKSFTAIWDGFARSGLPLCVHMGRTYPPFDQLVETRLEAHVIAMGMPAQLGFVAIVAQGMLDRYQNLKDAFLEFGAEWLFYVVGRLGHYLPSYRSDPTVREMAGCRRKPSKNISSRGDFLSPPKPTIPCCCRRSPSSATGKSCFRPITRMAKDATMPPARSWSEAISHRRRNEKFSTTTPSDFAASHSGSNRPSRCKLMAGSRCRFSKARQVVRPTNPNGVGLGAAALVGAIAESSPSTPARF